MKNAIIILISALFLSCNNSNESEDEIKYNGVNLNVGINLSVVNNQGEDLLNPLLEDGYKEEGIRMFYLLNNEVIEYAPDDWLDNPKGFEIFKSEIEDKYLLRILSLNYAETEEIPTTYLQWNENETDTLKVTYRRMGGSVLKETVLLNDVLIWDERVNGSSNYVTIEK